MNNVSSFLNDRKAAWLKAKLKPTQTQEEQTQLQQEANEKFALANWLPDAARRAPQLTMVSHPGKFSHPSAKTSPVIANNTRTNDGYLRTGNVDYELDVFGNAAAMDVYKFLSLTMADGKTVLAHLEEDSPEITALFTLPTASYDDLKQGFISIKQLDGASKTDHLVKQVYFPVDDDYHLLSLLTPSGLLTQVKTRIDFMRFSDETKQAKDSRRKKEHHATGYDDVLNLTVTAFGGTQPQNVSVLNSQNAGRAYLLASLPPSFQQRQNSPPNHDFFRNSLRAKAFKKDFSELDRLIRIDANKFSDRQNIEDCLKRIIDQVLQRVFSIRAYGVGWSEAEHYQDLPKYQRIWLDDAHLEQREQQDDWLDKVVADFARWLLDTYEYLFKDSYSHLSDYELKAVSNLVKQAVADDQEFFK